MKDEGLPERRPIIGALPLAHTIHTQRDGECGERGWIYACVREWGHPPSRVSMQLHRSQVILVFSRAMSPDYTCRGQRASQAP